MRTVLIISAQLKQYRLPLLVELALRLRRDGVVLRVAYSEPNQVERTKADTVELPDGIGAKIPVRWIFNNRFSIQHAWPLVGQADLVVIEQGNRHLFNYALIALSAFGLKRVAFWGHGYNRQSRRPDGASEWLKRRLLRRVDWWFAYTDGVAAYLRENGVASEMISVLHNTIDTRELQAEIAAIDASASCAVRSSLGIDEAARVGLFCGSLYEDKRLDFLIDAARQISDRLPGFKLIIVGDGPERSRVSAAAAMYPFIHYVGPAFGAARAGYFAISDVFLNPGLVGLAIVDAFAAGLPVLTTDIPIHSPEIEYLREGHNGLMTPHQVVTYAEQATALLSDPVALTGMKAGARASAAELPMSRMVDAFADGILRALET